MSGNVKQFIDYSVNTNSDTGENTASSILPITDGEGVTGTVLSRPAESLRQRSEAVRDVMADTLYLRDADRKFVLAGPGRVTWPGSTTVAASGIVSLSDTLWLLPVLSPGFAQAAPVPPVASSFGVLHLRRASDSMNSISVTSRRHSYAAGDQINVTVSAGGAFSCVLDSEIGFSRTIKIVATGATTLSTTIAALNGLIPGAPDNTQLVTAALEGGAAGSDLLLTTQAKQYVSGNFDGEGHAITPANLASFFSSNPTQVLAEGDSLCVAFSMVSDTASTGGRRQAIPENTNTAVPAASFFNSRVHPENLVNALPICKVVSGELVFGTGTALPAGAVAAPLSVSAAVSTLITGLAALTTTVGVVNGHTLGWVTIGNGTTVIGDFNTNAYANSKLLLDAAIASLPANGGTILLKRNVVLTGFAGSVVTVPGDMHVEIVGDHTAVPNVAQIVFSSGENLTCTDKTSLTLRNLHISHVANAVVIGPAGAYARFTADNCYFEKPSGTDAGAALTGGNISDVLVMNTRFSTYLTAGVTTAMVLRVSGTATHVRLENVRHTIANLDCGSVSIANMKNDFVIQNYFVEDAGSMTGGVTPNLMSFSTTDNTTNTQNRVISGYYQNTGVSVPQGIDIGNLGHLTISNSQISAVLGITAAAYAGAGPVIIRNCKLGGVRIVGAVPDLRITDCVIDTQVYIGDDTLALGKVWISGCRFVYSSCIVVHSLTLQQVVIDDNQFTNAANAATNAWALVKVFGITSIGTAKFTRNVIDGFQNIVYAGSLAPHQMFEVRTMVATLVVCTDNVCTNLLTGVSGVARNGVYLLKCTSKDDSTVSSVTAWGTIVVKRNTVGAALNGDYCMLFLLNKILSVTSIQVDDNDLNTTWWGGGGSDYTLLEAFVQLATQTGVGSFAQISMCNNRINITNADVTDLFKDVFYAGNGGTPQCNTFLFNNNNIWMNIATKKWDLVTAFGVQLVTMNVVGWCAIGNIIGRAGASTYPIFETKVTVGMPTVTSPPDPGAGVLWTLNTGMSRA